MNSLSTRVTVFVAAAMCLALGCAGVTIPPDPPLNAIELHHNASSASWYMTLNPNPQNFATVKGNKTIGGHHNPERYTFVEMSINYTSPAGWTIWAVPTSYGGHEVEDPLTEVWVYHTIPVSNDCGVGTISVNGEPAPGQYNDCDTGGFPVFHEGAYGFDVSLNSAVNVQGW